MAKRLLFLLVFLQVSFSYAQTIKTDVLVIGGSPAGVAAAIQIARSKVKTILVESSGQLCPKLQDATTITLNTDSNVPSGIWNEFRKRVRECYKKTQGSDTARNAPLRFEQDIGAKILTNIADSVKNLTVKLNTAFGLIKKDDDRWDITVADSGKTVLIKARVIIDATETGVIVEKAGAGYNAYYNTLLNGTPNDFRTSIASGNVPLVPGKSATDGVVQSYPLNPSWGIPLRGVVAKGAVNLFTTFPFFNAKADIDYLPAQLTMGQGAGASAAYCAFFKTTTDNLNVRKIQTELLDFKAYLLPFEDTNSDPYWRSIQQVCATGILRGIQKPINGKVEFVFDGDSTVTTAEIKPVMLEIYTRAFLWFNKEKPGREFTTGNLLSFISEITLNDPDNLQKTIAHDWGSKYNFTSGFDMDRLITRREFAILVNKYLNPFARTVDINGGVVN